jgi:hypothetical protein
LPYVKKTPYALGGSIRNRRRLVIHLGLYVLLGHVDVGDNAVKQIQTRLDLDECGTGLLHSFFIALRTNLV